MTYRNHFICHECEWQITWSYTRDKAGSPTHDADVGLIIAQHVEKEHPESMYGDSIPTRVYQKWKRLEKLVAR